MFKKLCIFCLTLGLLSACAGATKPVSRCTEDFSPINSDPVAKP